MALSQQKFREIVFLSLYSYDSGKGTEEDVIPLLMNELAVTRRSVKEAQHKVLEIQSQLPEIDPLIAKISTSYDFNRIQTVELNILRLGVFELLYDAKIPPKVAISEAMRLTRKFATPAAAAFVNAVLDRIYQMKQGKSVDNTAIEKTAEELQKSEEITRQISDDSATFTYEPKHPLSDL